MSRVEAFGKQSVGTSSLTYLLFSKIVIVVVVLFQYWYAQALT